MVRLKNCMELQRSGSNPRLLSMWPWASHVISLGFSSPSVTWSGGVMMRPLSVWSEGQEPSLATGRSCAKHGLSQPLGATLKKRWRFIAIPANHSLMGTREKLYPVAAPSKGSSTFHVSSWPKESGLDELIPFGDSCILSPCRVLIPVSRPVTFQLLQYPWSKQSILPL